MFPVLKSKKVKLVLQVNEDDRVMRDGVPPVEEGRGLLPLLKSQGKGLPVLYYILPFINLVAKGSYELKQLAFFSTSLD